MTKLISVLIVVVVVFCGFQIFKHWEKVRDEDELKQKEAAAAADPSRLPGMPPELSETLREATQRGPAAVRAWLKKYESHLQDPRKASIELDLCVAITREDPTEARRIFKAVKDRTPPDSPIQPRLKQLERSYQ